ncbi:MAG: trypsin-like peptidase domain-containing protein [Butyricicoccus sp.]|nr:trypsin-like peptidase domain-containing protein [Butyricicoccus sp.]
MLCLLLIVPQTAAFAAQTQTGYADSLYKLGVFYGTENGYELDRALTRAEGVALLVRMLGAEKDAQQMTDVQTPFTDVPAWASGYVGYAYENGLVAGIGDTMFGSEMAMTMQMYTVLMLRALGYTEADGDFTYVQALSFAQSLGLLDEQTVEEMTSNTFTRGDAAELTYDTLRFPVQGGNVLLVEQLAGKGKLDATAASQFLATVVSPTANKTELSLSQIAAKKESVVLLQGPTAEGVAQGSGVILSADGLIVTNYHVIDGMQSMTVTFDDGSVYEGTVYVEDTSESLDLALLRIDRTNLTPVTIGDSNSLAVGDTVVAIGSPYGLQNTVSEGIISSIRDNELQITAAISEGSSGGALFNAQGELIGVTYAGITAGQNLGFAIPIHALDSLTARNHQTLADFYEENSAVSAPSGLRLVQSAGNTVYLQWDAVEDADYYLLYYRTDPNAEYTLCSNFGSPHPFQHSSPYSAALTVNTRLSYEFAVTAVRDGVESPKSAVLQVPA